VELKRIQKDVGITFVYVTHDQEEALTMSDRIAVMHRGKIEQVGTPEDLYDRPASSFVADFIGTTNLLGGTVEALDTDTAIVRLDSGERCTIAAVGRAAGQPVQLSIRPEAIEIAQANGTEPASRLRAEIEQVAYLGAAVQYHIRTHQGLALTVLAGKARQRFESGDSVVLSWAPSDALVLGDRAAQKEES
jgi:spermidine/putrescine transport system ATP-binding protein